MKTRDIIRRSGRNLRQAKARTILTSLAIGVGAFTIALAMAAGNGGREYVDTLVSGLGDTRSVQVMPKLDDQTATEQDGPQKVGENTSQSSDYDSLKLTDIKTIEAVDGVETARPVFGVEANSFAANGSDEYTGAIAVQVDGTAIGLAAGELGDNNSIAAGDIVLPESYLKAFGFESPDKAIGKEVTIVFPRYDTSDSNATVAETFNIAAVSKESNNVLTLNADSFHISNEDGRRISAQQRPADSDEEYFAIMVVADDGVDINELKQKILDAGNYDAMTFEEMRESVASVISIAQWALAGFGALAIFASIFGIINTQYISVLTRTQQIGLMKALGARRKDIGRLFRYEAAWIGFLGGVIGVGLAFAVTLLNPVINEALSLEAGTTLLKIDWISSAILIAILVLIAVASGYFPARKAAKLDPVEALRTE